MALTIRDVRKKSYVCLTVGLAVGFTAACGDSSDNDGGGETPQVANSGPVIAGEAHEGAFEGVPLTFVSYGGNFQEGQEKAALEPFAEITGARPASDGPTLLSKLKAQVDSGNVSWDVVDTGPAEANVHCGELFMELDFDKIDISNVPEDSTGPCHVPAMRLNEMLIYNSDLVEEAPTGWADFFDVEKIPGKRGMIGTPGAMVGPLIAANLADGVSPDEMYPFDFDRAMAKLDSVKDNLVFWTTGAELQQLMESGEVVMAYAWSGRGMNSEINGTPLAPVWNEAIMMGDVLTVPKGVKNPDAAMSFLNFYLGKDQQEIMTEITSYSPVHINAQPDLDDIAEKWITTHSEKTEVGIAPDWEYWSQEEIYAQTEEIWNAWISQ